MRQNDPQKALHDACESGDIEAAMQALAAGADVNTAYGPHPPPLVTAIRYRNLDLARRLLAAIQQNDVQKALHYACGRGDIEAAMQALAAGADVMIAYGPHLPLVTAIRNENVDLARRLLAPPFSADPSLCEPNGHLGLNALHAAVRACEDVNWQAIELMLASGADTSMPTATAEPRTLLSLISHLSILCHMLSMGLQLEQHNEKGCTPLLQACKGADLCCVMALLDAGADIHATDNQGRGVLYLNRMAADIPRDIRAFLEPLDTLQVLLNHHKASRGAPLEVNARGSDGRTLLMWVAGYGRAVSVRSLLEAGADVAAVDGEGKTALQWVGTSGDFELAIYERTPWKERLYMVYKLLVDAGGDVIPQLKAEVDELKAEVVPARHLQALIVGAAAESRRLDLARAEQQKQAAELGQQREQLRLRERACAEIERELSLGQRLG